MKTISLIILILVFSKTVLCQQRFDEFNRERWKTSRNAMLVLGTWGSLNLVTGIIGAATAHGEAHYFHQMNLIWGATNLLIAAPAYFSSKNRPAGLSLSETVRLQSGSEKIYLLNAGLDLVYITAGAYCIQKGNNDSKQDLYRGYGKSLILQGGGLLIFDVVMSTIQLRHAKKLYHLLNSIQVSGSSAGIIWNCNLSDFIFYFKIPSIR